MVKFGIFGMNFPDRHVTAPILQQTFDSICETRAIVDENRAVRRQFGRLLIDRRVHRPQLPETVAARVRRKLEGRVSSTLNPVRKDPIFVTVVICDDAIKQFVKALGVA